MYRVVKAFSDAQDDRYVYHAGDVFPRDGLDVSEERVAALASTDNVRGEVLIVAADGPQKAQKRPVADETEPKDKSVESKPKRARKKGK